MFLLDIFFKSYNVFFRKKIEKGVTATVLLLSIPLGLNIALIFLFIVSFVIDLDDFGGPLFGFFVGMIVFITGMSLRYVYEKNTRYKLIIPYRFPALYYILGVIHYLFSIMTFISISVSMLSNNIE
jgi:hypothetical protein